MTISIAILVGLICYEAGWARGAWAQQKLCRSLEHGS